MKYIIDKNVIKYIIVPTEEKYNCHKVYLSKIYFLCKVRIKRYAETQKRGCRKTLILQQPLAHFH